MCWRGCFLAVLLTVFFPGELAFTMRHRGNNFTCLNDNLNEEGRIFMRLFHASACALFLLTLAPVGSFAADAKSDVTAAYAAWDAAFNKGDAKAVAAAYLPNAKLLPPTHEVASGPAAIEKFFAGLHANGVTNHKLEVIDAGGDDKVIYGTAKMVSPQTSKALPRTCSSAKRITR
jgi:ketosteroid isomerase-like protein